MTVQAETLYDCAQAIVAVANFAKKYGNIQLAPFGAGVSVVVQLIRAVVEEPEQPIDQALDEFEVKIKDWVNHRLDEKLQDFEADQLMIKYRGLRLRYAEIWHDIDKYINEYKTNYEEEHGVKPKDEEIPIDPVLKTELLGLAASFSNALPQLTDTQAYQLEVLPIFDLWVTLHMSVLADLKRLDPDQKEPIDVQNRFDTCLKEYLKAASIVATRIIRKVYDPGRIERTETITGKEASGGHEVTCTGYFQWEDKRTGTPSSQFKYHYADSDPVPNDRDRALANMERDITSTFGKEVDEWNAGIGLLKCLDKYKELTSEDDAYWAEIELLRKWSRLSGTLDITKTYGGDGGHEPFYLFPEFVNARLVKLECWPTPNGGTYVRGLRLTWEDGTVQEVHAAKQKADYPQKVLMTDKGEITEISLNCGPVKKGVIDSISFEVTWPDGRKSPGAIWGGKGGHEHKNVFLANGFKNARLIGVSGKAGNAIDSMQFIVEDRSSA